MLHCCVKVAPHERSQMTVTANIDQATAADTPRLFEVWEASVRATHDFLGEDAIAALVRVKGIGRWSAEIYLLFAEGRPDIWPAGDLAVQIEVGRLLGHPERPTEKRVRELAEAWRPHRGAAAIFAWHHYNSDMRVI